MQTTYLLDANGMDVFNRIFNPHRRVMEAVDLKGAYFELAGRFYDSLQRIISSDKVLSRLSLLRTGMGMQPWESVTLPSGPLVFSSSEIVADILSAYRIWDIQYHIDAEVERWATLNQLIPGYVCTSPMSHKLDEFERYADNVTDPAYLRAQQEFVDEEQQVLFQLPRGTLRFRFTPQRLRGWFMRLPGDPEGYTPELSLAIDGLHALANPQVLMEGRLARSLSVYLARTTLCSRGTVWSAAYPRPEDLRETHPIPGEPGGHPGNNLGAIAWTSKVLGRRIYGHPLEADPENRRVPLDGIY